MNKRDFLMQGGALVGAVAGGTALAAPASKGAGMPADAHLPTSAIPGGQQAQWQALQGERFSGLSTLGRELELTVSEVRAMPLAPAAQAAGLEQFTVSFEGPRALPLQAGLHQLHHPQAGTVQLYLEPVSRGERISYDAHFSLL